MDSLMSCLRNLRRKKLRSFLTIISIAIGVASVVIIGSIGQIGKETINTELGSLGLGSLTVSADSKLTNLKMSDEDLNLLREMPMVKSATPVVMNYTNVRMRGLVANTVLWGVDGKDNPLISVIPKYGRMINETDLANRANVCVVDSSMAKLFYKRENIVGKKLDAMIGGSYVTMEIIGVASSGGSIMQSMVGEMIPSFAYFPYTTLQRYTGDTSFEKIAVTLCNNDQTAAALGQVSSAVNRLHNIDRGFKTDNVATQKDTLNHIMDLITSILSAIAGVSLIVSGLGIMTVMIVSVNERTREIGIKKSIGATSTRILLEFIVEAFAISLIGSIIGLVLGTLAVWFGCLLTSLKLSLDPKLIISSILLSVGIGVIFGTYPATIAAGMPPVKALRTEC